MIPKRAYSTPIIIFSTLLDFCILKSPFLFLFCYNFNFFHFLLQCVSDFVGSIFAASLHKNNPQKFLPAGYHFISFLVYLFSTFGTEKGIIFKWCTTSCTELRSCRFTLYCLCLWFTKCNRRHCYGYILWLFCVIWCLSSWCPTHNTKSGIFTKFRSTCLAYFFCRILPLFLKLFFFLYWLLIRIRFFPLLWFIIWLFYRL